MPRQRNPKRDKARKLWLKSGKKRALKDIASELGVSGSTVRKWKSTDHWDSKLNRNAPIETERYDSMHENRNAAGNHGGAPPLNHNAVTHGLFAKWLPDETGEILDVVEQQQPADIIWQNIMLQYTAIIRAQKIMYVEDIDDRSRDAVTLTTQFAWDKQANFMAAQSRAMGTLSNLIKQFVSLADETDIRRGRLKLMKAQLKKAKAEARQISNDNDKTNMPLPEFVDDISEDEGAGSGSND
ncbi:phage terminase small subunit [Lactiplantibacillus xiangfangensis]|uniref:phage terminase small subunit n=1 Tax=Lactiplantibacillus xiangfangensis TaxID=942150 RepID=UPI00384E692E